MFWTDIPFSRLQNNIVLFIQNPSLFFQRIGESFALLFIKKQPIQLKCIYAVRKFFQEDIEIEEEDAKEEEEEQERENSNNEQEELQAEEESSGSKDNFSL